jgi:very-short-patch-repair endonuclease
VWNSGVLRERKVDTLVAAAAAEAMGVLSLDELRACGLSDEAVRSWERCGRLHRVHRGVYAVGHAGLTPQARWLAAVKACGAQAALSHTCALMLFGLVPVEERRPQVTIPATAKCTVAGVRVYRTRVLHPDDFRRYGGMRTASPTRALFDVASTTTDAGLRRLMSRAQAKRLTHPRVLGQQLDRAAGRPGRARFARVLATGPQPTRSELEDRVLDLIRAGGFAEPDVNVPLRIGGRRVIPDFRWPQLRLCVEADGAQWHDNPQARADDAERQALLEASGERVLRVTWEQAVAHIAQTHARIAAAGAPRAP